jgi:cyanoexosortase B-associated protein
MSLSKFFKQQQLTQVGVLLLLLIVLVIGAVPGYFTGKWQWKQPPPVKQLKEIKNIRKVGLNIPEWETIQHLESQIGEHKWSVQLLRHNNSSTEAILLVLPQNGPRDQPAVEWTDVSGWGKLRWGKWDIAQFSHREFTVKTPSSNDANVTQKIKARFFRSTTGQQTFAVLQWYATPNGGTYSPIQWFTADQLAQWQNQRVPWLAVSIMIPIESFGQVETSWPQMESLGEKVQTALLQVGL